MGHPTGLTVVNINAGNGQVVPAALIKAQMGDTQDITDGTYVNLGIGFPEMVAQYQTPGRQAIFRAEK